MAAPGAPAVGGLLAPAPLPSPLCPLAAHGGEGRSGAAWLPALRITAGAEWLHLHLLELLSTLPAPAAACVFAAAEAAQCEEGAVPALVLEPSLEELLEEAVRRSADKGTWKVRSTCGSGGAWCMAHHKELLSIAAGNASEYERVGSFQSVLKVYERGG